MEQSGQYSVLLRNTQIQLHSVLYLGDPFCTIIHLSRNLSLSHTIFSSIQVAFLEGTLI